MNLAVYFYFRRAIIFFSDCTSLQMTMT